MHENFVERWPREPHAVELVLVAAFGREELHHDEAAVDQRPLVVGFDQTALFVKHRNAVFELDENGARGRQQLPARLAGGKDLCVAPHRLFAHVDDQHVAELPLEQKPLNFLGAHRRRQRALALGVDRRLALIDHLPHNLVDGVLATQSVPV